jgi:UDP-N-acetylglucosamine transferase subunit ALG13
MLSKKQHQKAHNYLVNYYISSHGFGHCSRAVPIIKFLLNKNVKIRVISSIRQIEFLRRFFNQDENIFFDIKTTDVGWIFKEDGTTLDYKKLIDYLTSWLNSFPELIKDEIDKINQYSEQSIILSDISPLGFAVAKELNIYSIGISNFTWIEQYNNTNLPKEIVDRFREYYNYCDLYLRYPFHTPQIIGKRYEDIGYIVRDYDKEKAKEIRKIVLSSGAKIIIFLGIGASLNIKSKFEFGDDVFVFYGMGLNVNAKHKYYVGNEQDVQNYIAASDIVITKPGWSTVAECINAEVPMIIIKRDGIYEDKCILEEIENKELGIGMNIEKLNNLSANKLNSVINSVNKKTFSKFKKFDLNYLLNIISTKMSKIRSGV